MNKFVENVFEETIVDARALFSLGVNSYDDADYSYFSGVDSGIGYSNFSNSSEIWSGDNCLLLILLWILHQSLYSVNMLMKNNKIR